MHTKNHLDFHLIPWCPDHLGDHKHIDLQRAISESS